MLINSVLPRSNFIQKNFNSEKISFKQRNPRLIMPSKLDEAEFLSLDELINALKILPANDTPKDPLILTERISIKAVQRASSKAQRREVKDNPGAKGRIRLSNHHFKNNK